MINNPSKNSLATYTKHAALALLTAGSLSGCLQDQAPHVPSHADAVAEWQKDKSGELQVYMVNPTFNIFQVIHDEVYFAEVGGPTMRAYCTQDNAPKLVEWFITDRRNVTADGPVWRGEADADVFGTIRGCRDGIDNFYASIQGKITANAGGVWFTGDVDVFTFDASGDIVAAHADRNGVLELAVSWPTPSTLAIDVLPPPSNYATSALLTAVAPSSLIAAD